MGISSIVFGLFVIINVLGNIPLYIALLARFEPAHQRKILLREMLIAFGILLGFCFFGNHLLTLLGISAPIISIAGGTLLFLIALMMIFPKHEENSRPPTHEPYVFPLATPIIAGPGSITAVMVYSHQLENNWLMTLAIFLAWAPSLAIVLLSSHFKKLLGDKGLIACERVGGMLITLMAVQMIIQGIMDAVRAEFF